MIKKIISSLLFFFVVSVFSQQAKDLMGVPETIEFVGLKYVLAKSSKNPDHSIIQEYIPYNGESKKNLEKESSEKLIIIFNALNEGNAKEPLEKKLEDIRKIKNAQNVVTDELGNNFYKISYQVAKNNALEKNNIFFRLTENEKGYDAYLFEYLGGTKERRENLEIGFRKFAETFPNQ